MLIEFIPGLFPFPFFILCFSVLVFNVCFSTGSFLSGLSSNLLFRGFSLGIRLRTTRTRSSVYYTTTDLLSSFRYVILSASGTCRICSIILGIFLLGIHQIIILVLIVRALYSLFMRFCGGVVFHPRVGCAYAVLHGIDMWWLYFSI